MKKTLSVLLAVMMAVCAFAGGNKEKAAEAGGKV